VTTRPIVERLIPIELVYAVVYHGVADRSHPDHAAVLDELMRAQMVELEGLPVPKRDSAIRHAAKAADAILKPFVEGGEKCSKVGLALFYVIRELIDTGAYDLRDGPFSEAMDAVLNPEGTVTEMANIELLDRSAQKQARKVLAHLRELGYYAN
jgi:hypothetical protein